MFRYIALAWDDTIALHASAAQRLSRALRAQAGWQGALLAPGLHVFTTGARQGINGVYCLPAQRAVVLGRLFRRREPGSEVSSDPQISAEEAERIVRTEGRALVGDWWGRYVAFLPAPCGDLRVLRDPSAALPCFHMRHQGVGIAFSWLEDLLQAWPGMPMPAVDWDHLGAHLLLGRLGGVETALQGVHHVPAGTLASLTGGSTQPGLPWNAVDFARQVIDQPHALAADRLRQTVRACARAWTGCYDAILLRLSGGVDSAILLGCLDDAMPSGGLTCLNYHAPGADGDERAYARLAARRAGHLLIERECDAGFPLDAVLDVALTPAPESYLGRLSMARMDAELAAARHARALFTGGGGDQLFFELRCTWPAADYLRVRGIDAGFPVAVADAARLGRVSVWRATWLALRDGLRPPDLGEHAGQHLCLVTDELRAAVHGAGCFLHPALHAPTALPIGKLRQTLELISPAGYYDPYQREAAPEIVNPLLSQPVMELCLALPTYLLTHGGRGRALARQAFAGDIPAQIATRRTKGGMEEHITAVLQRHLVFARGLLLDGQLVGRGLLDRARLQASLSGRPAAREAHVGEIHNCIAIEAWLQRWSALSRSRAM
jgi:asparagine synthase (glutamine-hydrolysing)